MIGKKRVEPKGERGIRVACTRLVSFSEVLCEDITPKTSSSYQMLRFIDARGIK